MAPAIAQPDGIRICPSFVSLRPTLLAKNKGVCREAAFLPLYRRLCLRFLCDYLLLEYLVCRPLSTWRSRYMVYTYKRRT